MSRDPFDKILEAAFEGLEFQLRIKHEQREVQSPIERLFASALDVAASYVRRRHYSKIEWRYPYVPLDLTPERTNDLYAQWQVSIGAYRVDFLLTCYNQTLDEMNENGEFPYFQNRWQKIVVECDGHAFHEKTKEQAARDKARDRFLALDGCRVIRFTGSEIWRDPMACAMQVLQLCEGGE